MRPLDLRVFDRYRLTSITIVQCSSLTEISDIEEKDSFFFLRAVTRSSGGGSWRHSDSTLLGHIIRKHLLGSRNNNSGRFVNLCSFHRLVIYGTTFEYKACHTVSWVSTDGHRPISSRLCSGCAYQKNARFTFERDHFICLRVASTTPCSVGKMWFPKFSIDRL